MPKKTISKLNREAKLLVSCLAIMLSACSSVPTSGPSTSAITSQTSTNLDNRGIQVVDINEQVARDLLAQRQEANFRKQFGTEALKQKRLAAGDAIEISVWEAPPATLFSAITSNSNTSGNSRIVILPEQTIDTNGIITVPFAGKINVIGKPLNELEQEITQRLKGKANQAQVNVRLTRNTTSYATVIGDVNSSVRMPLTPRGELLLDALAAAGGTKQAINKTVVQLTRGVQVQSMPLEQVIRDPLQNITLQPGDVVTALFQPFSFTVLGATGKNDEINFEGQGITLAQALGRVGGLQDSRAHAAGVFIFRFENKNALAWQDKSTYATANGKIPGDLSTRFD
ncbi:polysaccharide biosynthesis/export family protein [Deefgea sp. CFH1-16]|uniref:polysaccharide biosynthesis/export family protein n=1 Tax=Deefgea sp. CFH1-16 TaxID=2675457 RepID=UPI0019402E5F|nr:polysaccharide biosynthesis/export family protein [Deefgea sp. CFH1-16]